MAARLKVFITSDGLTDYVVATTSKPKALAAWGSHQDLFKTGLARETDDPELAKAAKAQPDQVLRRPAGSRATLAKLKPVKRPRPEPPPKPKGPSKAALRKAAQLEKEVAAAEADLARRQADLATLREKLSAARQALG